MDEKKSVEEYMAELGDIVLLEESLCRQKKTAEVYADYTYIPREPPQYRNRASLGMISLSVTWVLFDIFAFQRFTNHLEYFSHSKELHFHLLSEV